MHIAELLWGSGLSKFGAVLAGAEVEMALPCLLSLPRVALQFPAAVICLCVLSFHLCLYGCIIC